MKHTAAWEPLPGLKRIAYLDEDFGPVLYKGPRGFYLVDLEVDEGTVEDEEMRIQRISEKVPVRVVFNYEEIRADGHHEEDILEALGAHVTVLLEDRTTDQAKLLGTEVYPITWRALGILLKLTPLRTKFTHRTTKLVGVLADALERRVPEQK